jgi:hypothetical protein
LLLISKDYTMANTVKIESPHSGDTIQVPGSLGNWILPTVHGMALVSTGTLSEVSVRMCDPGSSVSCATPKAADQVIPVGVYGGISVYSWTATNIPVKNASTYPGSPNDLRATLVTTGPAGSVEDTITFNAVGGTFPVAALATRARVRRTYRVRFDVSTLPPLFNRLAALGMNVSKRVRLVKSGGKWVSDDNAWTLEVEGTSAKISAEIQIAAGISDTQAWICPDFHARLGGVFSPQSALVPVNLLVS